MQEKLGECIFLYNVAPELDSEYILKTIMKHCIREKENSNLLVYEQFDTKFEEWLKDNEFSEVVMYS